MIPYLPNFNLDKVLTLKLLEYIAMGANTVAFNLKAIENLLGKEDFVGIAHSVEEFVAHLAKAVKRPRSQKAIDLIHSNFSWDAVAGRIVEEATR
jgi:hypothetical protein